MTEVIMTIQPVDTSTREALDVQDRIENLGAYVVNIPLGVQGDADLAECILKEEDVTQVWLLGPQPPASPFRNRAVAVADKAGLPIRPVHLDVDDERLKEMLSPIHNDENNEEQ